MYDISLECGIPRPTISRYVSGLRVPSIETIVKLATYFNVSTDWLLGLSDDRDTSNFSEEIKNIIAIYPFVTVDDRNVIQMILNKYGKK